MKVASTILGTSLIFAFSIGGAQDPESKPASKPASAPSAPASQDFGPPPRGAAPIFDKRERTEFTKKVIEFLEARVKMTEEKQDHGTDTPTFKAAEKSFKTKEDALKAFLKTLAKKYNLDPDCLGALADWQSAITDYHVKHNDYKKSKYSLGSEQGERLREEPKNDYTRRIPKTYDPQAKAWPLLLVVQDKGKLSKQVTSPMPKAGETTGGGELAYAPLLDGEGDLQGHVTVAVDIPDAVWDDPQKLYAAILRPLGDVRSVLRIDPNRVVIGGIGRGARAAASVVRFAPQFFSAFVAKGGEPGDVRPENFSNIPVYILGDASAWEKPPEGADGADKESWLSRAKSLGIEVAQDPESKLPELTTWLSKRVRNPYTPHAQSVVKTDRRQSATYWLKFDPDPAREARMEAKVDRATNTIDIQSDGVTRYYLFLSDAILDLTKVVKIKTNDREWTGKLPPVYATFLNCIQESGTLDYGGLYTVSFTVDVKREKKSGDSK